MNHNYITLLLISCGGEMMNMKNSGSTYIEEDTKAETEETEEAQPEEPTQPDICATMYHPIHESGWTKEYIARQNGVEGLAREEGLGTVMENGIEVYQYQDTLETYHSSWFGTETHGWDMTISVSCNHNDQQGMFLLGWTGTFRSDDTWGQWQEMTAKHDEPRKYLPSEYTLGYEGSWSYDYDILLDVQISGGSYPSAQNISGTYQEVGFQSITLFNGEVVDAYKLVHSFTMNTEDGDSIQGYIEQYWVKGLGLVKEVYINPIDASEILSKELSAYSGLEIIE